MARRGRRPRRCFFGRKNSPFLGHICLQKEAKSQIGEKSPKKCYFRRPKKWPFCTQVVQKNTKKGKSYPRTNGPFWPVARLDRQFSRFWPFRNPKKTRFLQVGVYHFFTPFFGVKNRIFPGRIGHFGSKSANY